MIEVLFSQLEKHEYAGGIVPFGRIYDLKEGTKSSYDKGNLDEEFYKERLDFF